MTDLCIAASHDVQTGSSSETSDPQPPDVVTKTRKPKPKITDNDIIPFWSSASDEISNTLNFIPTLSVRCEVKAPCNSTNNYISQRMEKLDSPTFSTLNESLYPHNTVTYNARRPRRTPRKVSKPKTKKGNTTFSKKNYTYKVLTRKIRIYPNKEQTKLFTKCFQAHRYIYNKGVERFNLKKKSSYVKIKKKVVTADSELPENEKWLKEIPYDTRTEAVRNLCKNITSAFSNFYNGNIKSFNMKFLSKKRSNDIFFIKHKSVFRIMKNVLPEFRPPTYTDTIDITPTYVTCIDDAVVTDTSTDTSTLAEGNDVSECNNASDDINVQDKNKVFVSLGCS